MIDKKLRVDTSIVLKIYTKKLEVSADFSPRDNGKKGPLALREPIIQGEIIFKAKLICKINTAMKAI